MTAHVEVTSVGYSWGAANSAEGLTEALRDVSFSVAQGEFCAVVGGSGSGKSTLLRLIAGLASPTVGKIDVHQTDAERPLNTLVLQDHGVFPWMRVRDNVGYALAMRGVAATQRAALVASWLDKIGLTKFADAWPHQLSGGMRQRVAVARALANSPEILLMDEPFASLDELTRTALGDELLALWSEVRSTVILVTHNLSEAVALADRVIVLGGQPGEVRDIVPIDLPRPRGGFQIRANPEFGALVYRLWTSLQP